MHTIDNIPRLVFVFKERPQKGKVDTSSKNSTDNQIFLMLILIDISMFCHLFLDRGDLWASLDLIWKTL